MAAPLNPLLAPLGDYGGPTQTMPLLPGSPAIGAGAVADVPGTTTPITTDQRGFALDSPDPDIGAFQSQPGYSLVVQTTGDIGAPAGEFDLRGAIDIANVLGAAETISFSPTAFGTAQTINLTQGQLVLSDTGGTETITAPPAGLTISGNHASRVFLVDKGVTASLSGLTITGGSTSGDGGGLDNLGTATLTDCTIAGNSAGEFGGGLENKGTATLTDCTISGNSAADDGGGLYNYAGPVHMYPATLTDTIVAGNVTQGGVASDIGGAGAGEVTGTYNLTGTGGSGGLTAAGHNLLNVANPGLGILGNYGGTTQTIPLLPGSPALGAGIEADVPGTTTPIATDQRDEPLDSPKPDIGAFQSQGFTLTSVAAGTQQSTLVNSTFTNPLAVTVTANNPLEPVAGGVISFTAPSSGASATLSASTVVIGSSGQASVTATANGTFGSYTVIASTAGAGSPADFSLTNVVQTAFSGLAAPTIVYGTSTVTLSGTILAGSTAPLGSVSITLAGTTQSASIDSSNGSFSSAFNDTAGLGVETSPYSISYAYASSGAFVGITNTSQVLTVTPAPLTVTAESATRTFGQANPTFTDMITGFVNNETDAVVSGSPGFTTLATATSPPAPYAITPTVGTLAVANYDFTTFDPGTLTVVPQATATLAPVASLTNVAVASVAVTFSEPINASSLGGQDVTLTLDGGNLAASSLTFIPQGDNTYLIDGLSALTGSDGEYDLTFLTSSVLDVNGAAGVGSASVSWLMDTTAPSSQVLNTLGTSQTSDTFPVSVTFTDPAPPGGAPAVGVAMVELFVSVNNGPFSLSQAMSLATPEASGTVAFTFNGQDRNTYAFHSITIDALGNVENKSSTTIEASTSVPDLNPPITHVLSSNPTYSWGSYPSSDFSGLTVSTFNQMAGVFTLNWAGVDPDQNSGRLPDRSRLWIFMWRLMAARPRHWLAS